MVKIILANVHRMGEIKRMAYVYGKIVDRVAAGLRHREAERAVVKEDVDIPLSIRCRSEQNLSESEEMILISIHCNAAALGIDWLSAHGWSVFVSNNASANSKCLAQSLGLNLLLCNLFLSVSQCQDNCFGTQNLAICRDTICPSV